MPICPKCGSLIFEEELNGRTETITAQTVYDYYNSTVRNLDPAAGLTEKRRKQIKTRLARSGFWDNFKKAVKIADSSSFCLGDNSDGWRVTFGWLIHNDENVLKVLEWGKGKKKLPQSMMEMEPQRTKSLNL